MSPAAVVPLTGTRTLRDLNKQVRRRNQSFHVRFGSKADICAATSHVRFTPNSDRKSGFPNKVMSALLPKADMCSALAYVCYGPIADIACVV
jgi:hypothetical protein